MRRLLPELVLALAVSAGCSSSTIVIKESRTTAPGPFERLAVFVSLPAGGGDRGIYHGFKKAMTSKLAACAIESSIVAGMPPKPDEGNPAPDASPSGAQLIVRARYGQLTTVTTVDQYGIVHDEKAFKELELDLWFELLDHSKRVTWLAFAKLHMKDSGNVAGEKLAHTMVERLRSDGVLKRCR